MGRSDYGVGVAAGTESAILLGNCLSSRYTTNSTGVCFYAFFCNCCRFGDYTVIPCVLAEAGISVTSILLSQRVQ